MKPLSNTKYLLKNIKKIALVFLAIASGVFLIYFYSIFSATSKSMISSASFDIMKKYNIIYSKNNASVKDAVAGRIPNDKIIPVDMSLPSFKYERGGLGSTVILSLNIMNEDAQKVMNGLGAVLESGRLPENDKKEILLHKSFALQNGLKIGDVMPNNYIVSDEYTICGIFSCDSVFSLVCQPNGLTRDQLLDKGMIIDRENMSDKEMDAITSSLSNGIDYYTYSSFRDSYALSINSMQSMTYIITAAMIIILCIALSNLNVIAFYNRINEIKILKCIGYSSNYLSLRLLVENLTVCIAAFVTGIFSTEIIVMLLNKFLMIPSGKYLDIISISGIVSAALLPLLVSCISMIPCIRRTYKIQIC